MLELYNKSLSFTENVKEGPFFCGEIPKHVQPDKNEWPNILGYQVASRVGIPACAIMTSNGIALMSKLGFDVLTYKTIRSKSHPAYEKPNILFADQPQQISSENFDDQIKITPNFSGAIANSIGNASFDLGWMQEDIQKSRSVLNEGQLLIVSVYGTGATLAEVAADFAHTAKAAVEAGAQVVECNFSCPNLQDDVYQNAECVETILKKVITAVAPIPVTFKAGLFLDAKTIRDVLVTAARAGAQGVCGINAVRMKVVDKNGKPAFGAGREKAGVSGNPIRNLTLQFVRDARNIIKREKLGLTLFATGGIVAPQHFNQFFDAGADVAMSATGAMYNPYLAMEFHNQVVQRKTNDQTRTGVQTL